MKAKSKRVRKSVAVIGEGLTEYRYIDDLRTTERYRFSLVPGMPKHTDIDDIVRLARDRVSAGYDYVICLVDMDVITGNREKMERYKALRKANPEVIFVESSPCVEYWFLMHYMSGVSSREYAAYEQVAAELRKQIRDYEKTEEFFNKNHIYRELKERGDMEMAIALSRELDELRKREPEMYRSYSQMYKLFDVIESVLECGKDVSRRGWDGACRT